MQIVPSQATSHLRALIAQTIDREMVERDLTNRALADQIGSTEHQVWRWRRGRIRPSDENLAALASVLTDGDIAAFFTGPDPDRAAA